VRIKGHCRTDGAESVGAFDNMFEDRLVSEMDAIEVADRQNRAAWRLIGSEWV
jgi:hypothetical protein